MHDPARFDPAADSSTGTGAGPGATAHRRPGRPQDPQVTEQIIRTTRALLATEGTAVTADVIAAEAGVGKATIYRRWDRLPDLIAHAARTTEPLPPAGESAGLRGDLAQLLEPLGRPRTTDQVVIAALIGPAGRNELFDRVVEDVLLTPLRTRLDTAFSLGRPASSAPGAPVGVVGVVHGLWIRHCLFDRSLHRDGEPERWSIWLAESH